jgi:hypothetical protein
MTSALMHTIARTVVTEALVATAITFRTTSIGRSRSAWD